ncbi:MAG: hypothetical protein Q8930_01895 [Bacillota bacterium]|nr:hypothetical protein [Bacillota bacterium]
MDYYQNHYNTEIPVVPGIIALILIFITPCCELEHSLVYALNSCNDNTIGFSHYALTKKESR